MLWNSLVSTIFPIFSFFQMNHHMFPLQTSLPPQTGFIIFPLLFPTPCSLRWNPIPIFLLFPILHWLIRPRFSFYFILVLYAFSFKFRSYCATVLQQCSNVLISFHFSFLISHLTAPFLGHYLSIG